MLYSDIPKNLIRDAKDPGFSWAQKDIFDDDCEHFDFPTMNRGICKSRTATNRPLTRKNKKREEDVQKRDCRVWTETGKGEEQTCTENSPSELNILRLGRVRNSPVKRIH
jgi:hypothetical protein